MSTNCRHSKQWPIGEIPEASFPLAIDELPSEYRDDILAGVLKIPQGDNYRAHVEVIPRRTIMHCSSCGYFSLVPVKK